MCVNRGLVPRIWTEPDERGVIELNVGPQALVISIQEVFSAPDPNGAVVRARRKVFPIATKIQTGHIAVVTLEVNKTESRINFEIIN